VPQSQVRLPVRDPALRGRDHGRVATGQTRQVKRYRVNIPAGVRDVAGPFDRGDHVPVYDEAGRRIAIGVTNYGHEALAKIRGLRSDRIAETLGYEYGAEVVHRNNLVLL